MGNLREQSFTARAPLQIPIQTSGIPVMQLVVELRDETPVVGPTRETR